MDQSSLPEGTKRIINICAILILISSFVVVLIGNSLKTINSEVKQLNAFLVNAEGIQANFEKSLQLYTQGTQHVIDFVLTLRPQKEQEYIKFISEVEKIAESLNLKINLQSLPPELQKPGTPINEKTLDYIINFYGNQENLRNFLQRLESLDYFIKVESIDFRNLQSLAENEDIQENIDLKIKLYIK